MRKGRETSIHLQCEHEMSTVRKMQRERKAQTAVYQGDARHLPFIEDESIDLIVTSPPYWQRRDYGHPRQIGKERTSKEYITSLIECLHEWKRLLKSSGSIFINLGDTYRDRQVVGVPEHFMVAAQEAGWYIQHRIIWPKEYGVPEPKPYRLASRHEFIFHLSKCRKIYTDLFGYSQVYGNGFNPGDVWKIRHSRSDTDHLAPFPEELAARAINFACPIYVCPKCDKAFAREVRRSLSLNPDRPQAKRAMELFERSHLTEEHLAAIRATGISDAGKALQIQGSNKNTERIQELALEAKRVLGGYFREFTFPLKEHAGWTRCVCNAPPIPGVVLDPFMGSQTTIRAASKLKRRAIGVDLVIL
jgi:DNA modification methylase